MLVADTSEQTGELTLGHVVTALGQVNISDVIALRHTIRPKDPTSLQNLTETSVLEYTRVQKVATNIFPKTPPRLWLVFAAEGARGTHSRFYRGYENNGEVLSERTETDRAYDLRPSLVLNSLRNRMVIDWGAGAIGWAKNGAKAAALPIAEIADPTVMPFPGYGGVLLSYDELRKVVNDAVYLAWRNALESVQGIYAIADTRTGQLYIGKADGAERILGRWTTYARDGHGGNAALKELGVDDPTHKHDFVFSILRVFDPSAPLAEVNAAESHFKRALLTRAFGHNRN